MKLPDAEVGELKILQINLNKSKVASAELLLILEGIGYDLALVQEPWISLVNMVSRLKSPSYNTYISSATNKVRTVILYMIYMMRSLHSHIDLNFPSHTAGTEV